ncbi:MAG: FAD-dependent thymidylate synthase [Nanoarchaeota archaeon]
MVDIIEPKVKIVDYGPEFRFSNGKKITPDEFVYAAANITYKDIGALQEFMELKETEADLEGKVSNALITVAGAGHASMATTPGLWIFLEGTCSKLVDSIFTGAKFGSSLMPSGRRVPIDISQIVIPKGIREKGEKAEKIYLETSERNIRTYEEVQKRGVSKQEASKIVQYGHRGGGFMFMPLETFIYFSKLIEEDPNAMPREGKEIISQIEEKMNSMGMDITYCARKEAPRTGVVNPNIFHFRKNLAEELRKNYSSSPAIINCNIILSKERAKRIIEYLKNRNEILRDSELIKKNWKYLLVELDQIVRDFNDSVSVVTSTLTPWRVWGEVKRHRTLPQTAESVYHATSKAIKEIKENGNDPDIFKNIVSIPSGLTQDSEAFLNWTESFKNSLESYNTLLEMGVPKSDAIAVIPRGLKLGVIKRFDFYNLTLGYMSLRLCETAEPEMRKITEQERRLIKNSPAMPEIIGNLIDEKCIYTGFCPEKNFCNRIEIAPGLVYSEEIHKEFKEKRKEEIKSKLL